MYCYLPLVNYFSNPILIIFISVPSSEKEIKTTIDKNMEKIKEKLAGFAKLMESEHVGISFSLLSKCLSDTMDIYILIQVNFKNRSIYHWLYSTTRI